MKGVWDLSSPPLPLQILLPIFDNSELLMHPVPGMSNRRGEGSVGKTNVDKQGMFAALRSFQVMR